MKKQRAPLYVTSLIAAAFFMENLDGTIIATALPQMARSFHAGAVSLNVGMTAYLITLAVFIPISGWMADRFGSRSVFASAIGVFTIASLLCGASKTLSRCDASSGELHPLGTQAIVGGFPCGCSTWWGLLQFTSTSNRSETFNARLAAMNAGGQTVLHLDLCSSCSADDTWAGL